MYGNIIAEPDIVQRNFNESLTMFNVDGSPFVLNPEKLAEMKALDTKIIEAKKFKEKIEIAKSDALYKQALSESLTILRSYISDIKLRNIDKRYENFKTYQKMITGRIPADAYQIFNRPHEKATKIDPPYV